MPDPSLAMGPAVKRRLTCLVALTALGGCTTPEPRATNGLAPLGRTVTVGPLQVTPYQLLEDSRCPQAVRCVWQGRVRIMARVSTEVRELTLGQPVPAGDGALLLAEALPPRRPEAEIAAADYRFRFRFTPGS